jgi:hypothetical protein
MKYVISFFFAIGAHASPIQIYHEGLVEEAHKYKEILINDYFIPEDLILVKGIGSCEQIKGKGKLDLCLKNNGDLLMVSVDRSFINESLKVFRAP